MWIIYYQLLFRSFLRKNKEFIIAHWNYYSLVIQIHSMEICSNSVNDILKVTNPNLSSQMCNSLCILIIKQNLFLYFCTEIIKVLSARMLQVTHPFVASKTKSASNLCKIHTRKFLTYLEKMEMWALKSKLRNHN